MPFTSLRYALFLPVVVAAYFGCPPRFRWLLLLGASYFFYANWDAGFLGALVASTLLTYLLALGMARQTADPGRHRWLSVGVVGNLGLLVVFKYLAIFPGILAPIGISFFTLQAIGYLLDVLREERPPERHIGYFASYMAFFPHVTAGPIPRSTRVLPQFRGAPAAQYHQLSCGMRQVMWGLFQKVVVADNLGMFVDSVYGDVRLYSGFPLLFATFFFSMQLYCDFAGYSNVALGSAKLLGFDLMKNFDRPYLAQSLAEFWRRWHISLSCWLADNVHKPLAVSLRANPRAGLVTAVLTTFILCGLWHGATYNYLAWGLLHGVGLSALVLTSRQRKRFERQVPALAYSVACVLLTFVFVSFTWIFFRANDMSDALYVVRHIGALEPGVLIGVPTISRGTFVKDVVLALVVILSDVFAPSLDRALAWLGPSLGNYCCLVGLGFCIYVFGAFEKQSFIYAQF